MTQFVLPLIPLIRTEELANQPDPKRNAKAFEKTQGMLADIKAKNQDLAAHAHAISTGHSNHPQSG